MKILLVEDDKTMRETLVRAFTRLGWLVQACANGQEALVVWQKLSLDVVLLDLSLPERDGLDILADARQLGLSTPVIILTARGTVGDRILGLNMGADDYLPKPFDLDELEARMRALARAHARKPWPDSPAFEEKSTISRHKSYIDSYQFNSNYLSIQGQALDLSPREFSLAQALHEHMGQALPKEQLLSRVFPDQADVQAEAIEVVAYRLRKKLAGTGLKLVTLRGLGYLLKEELA